MTDNGARLPVQPSLTGRKVYLRPTTADDIRINYEWWVLSDPQSLTCRPWVYRSAEENVEAFKSRTVSDSKQAFTVCRIEDGRPVGEVNFFGLNTLNRSAELGVLINPDEQRKGHAYDALTVLIDHLFRFRGLHKVYAQTGGFNSKTIALLEKLGFKRDAVLRDHYYWNGSFHPGYIYSLLAAELARSLDLEAGSPSE